MSAMFPETPEDLKFGEYDANMPSKRRTAARAEHIARFVAISEALTPGDIAASYTSPGPELPATPFQEAWLRFRAAVARRWLWNVAFPVKMWFHFTFRAGQALPDDKATVRALLRDAFAENGIDNSPASWVITLND